MNEGNKVEEPIVLKISSNFPIIFKGVHKHFDYLNNLYHANQIPFYIEGIEEGFLFIARYQNIFEKIADSEIISRKLKDVQENPPIINKNFEKLLTSIEQIQSNQKTKKLNLIFKIECNMNNSEYLFEIIKKGFFRVNPNIKVLPADFNLIEVEFKSMDEFRSYIKLWISYTSDLIDRLN
ncbi:hypothetical protein [Candidatus Harpocratesius sp.]